MEKRVSWIQNGPIFKRIEGTVKNPEVVPVGIYNLNFNPMGGWCLERIQDKFVFNFKLYGLQKDFVSHVIEAYKGLSGNLGILMNGTKGTGKTVTAKVIANELNLPIILVKSFEDMNQSMIEFISTFNFDCVLFFDEFEKNFSKNDSSILQIMDGAYNSTYRKIFLLTTNETSVNDNLISRPSRIRYLKEFGNLEEEVVLEYLNDNLEDKKYTEDVLSFIDTLEISTIDILKSIVEEINLFGFDKFEQTRQDFNIKTAYYEYSVYRACIDSRILKKFSIEDFVKEVKAYASRKFYIREDFVTEEEYREAVKIQNEKYPHRPSLRNVNYLRKPFKRFKIGDHFGIFDSEAIIKVDLKNNVIITIEDIDMTPDNATYYFYYINNPEASPSLYGKGTSNLEYTCAYYD